MLLIAELGWRRKTVGLKSQADIAVLSLGLGELLHFCCWTVVTHSQMQITRGGYWSLVLSLATGTVTATACKPLAPDTFCKDEVEPVLIRQGGESRDRVRTEARLQLNRQQ